MKIYLLALLILCIPLAAAVPAVRIGLDTGDADNVTITNNYYNSTANNTYYWQGYTPSTFFNWLVGFFYQKDEVYNKTEIDANNDSWSSTYNSTYATWAYNQSDGGGGSYNATYDAHTLNTSNPHDTTLQQGYDSGDDGRDNTPIKIKYGAITLSLYTGNIIILSPNNTVFTSTTAWFNISLVNGSSCRHKLDGGAWTNMTKQNDTFYNSSKGSLLTGEHTVKFNCTYLNGSEIITGKSYFIIDDTIGFTPQPPNAGVKGTPAISLGGIARITTSGNIAVKKVWTDDMYITNNFIPTNDSLLDLGWFAGGVEGSSKRFLRNIYFSGEIASGIGGFGITELLRKVSINGSSGNIYTIGNINTTGNIYAQNYTGNYGFFSYLGSSVSRILKGWFNDIDVNGTAQLNIVNATGKSYLQGNVTIGYDTTANLFMNGGTIRNVTSINPLGSPLQIGGEVNITGNTNIVGNLSVKRYYWNGYDNSTQTFANTSLVQVINISNNNDYDAYGIVVVGNQNLTFQHTGDYMCVLSPEFYQNSGNNKLIAFWYQKNGVDVPWSNSRWTMSNGVYQAPAITYQFDIDNPATDNIRFMWYSDSTASQIISIEPPTNPTRPGIPGVLLNCQKVSEIT